MADIEGREVTLHVYDLSSGLAKQLSLALLGKQIYGVWHTSIVLDHTEWWYGCGIQSATPPGTSHFGVPVHKMSLGKTSIPPEVFSEYIADVSKIWRPELYSLFENNCNNFSDEVANFLTGSGIPKYILELPKEVLATPFGQMIAPSLGEVQGKLNSPPHPPKHPDTPFSFAPDNVTAAVTDSLRAATATVLADTGIPLDPVSSRALSTGDRQDNMKKLAEASQALSEQKTDLHGMSGSLKRTSLGRDSRDPFGIPLGHTAGFPAPVSRRLTTARSGEIITRLGSGQLPQPQMSPRSSLTLSLPPQEPRRHSASNVLLDGPREPKDGTKAQPGPSSARSIGVNARVSYDLQRSHSLSSGQTKEIMAKVRQEFNSIMAQGGVGANEAAAKALRRVVAVTPSAA